MTASPSRTLSRAFAGLALVGLVQCTGRFPGGSAQGGPSGSAGAGGKGGASNVSLADPAALGATPMRRLTRKELIRAIQDALGVDTTDLVEMAYPTDAMLPFDNDAADQATSTRTLVQGIDVIAKDAATRALASPAVRAKLLACQPKGAGDADCLRQFVEGVAPRLLRRPLAPGEADAYVHQFAPFALEAGDFDVAAQLVVRSLLQDPEFLYRLEVGTPVAGRPGLSRLTDAELASRMSFLLWGAAPDDVLQQHVAAGDLSTAEGVQHVADEMLRDPRAATQLARYHAMWLGYEKESRLPPALADAMRQESQMLVRRVVLEEQRPWFDLFKFEETYVDAPLALHYGLPPPAVPGWVSYAGTDRKGILSHATFLAASSPKPGDTSPTQRGLFVRSRLLCQHIPPPSPAILQSNTCVDDSNCGANSHCRQVDPTKKVCIIDVDAPPSGSACKVARYQQHAQGVCAGCHIRMDPIGFGLEPYALDGHLRSTDDGRPDCPLDGHGEVLGLGTFQGPGQLGALLAQSSDFEACAATQLFRYVQGRKETPDDQASIGRVRAQLSLQHNNLRGLLVDLVSSEAFRSRVQPP